MKNKTFLILIGIGLIIALCGLFTLMLTYFESGELLLNTGLSIVNLLGFIMLIRNGTLTKTIFFRFMSFCISFVIIGALFKIMHWPGSMILLSVGLLGIAIIYVFRFIKKPVKGPLDIMKCIWVVTAYVTALCVTMHWVPRQVVLIPNLIMLATIIFFASNCMKNKELLEK